MTQERILPAAAAPASRPLPLRSLARHLVIRLMPPILLLVLLDLIATWVITHKIEMSMWMLEDFLWLMVLGQIVLIVMFTWVVVQGVRSGLRSVNHLSEEIRQRPSTTCSRWKWPACRSRSSRWSRTPTTCCCVWTPHWRRSGASSAMRPISCARRCPACGWSPS